MTGVSFVVEGHAEPAGSKTAFVNPKTKRAIVTDANRKSKPWQRVVASAAADAMAGRPLMRGPVAVTMTFYRARPKGHYGARGLLPSAPSHPTTRPDVLKLARGVEDAMTGVAWGDDAQIVAEMLRKEYGEPERVEVSLWEVEPEAPAPVQSSLEISVPPVRMDDGPAY